MTKDEIEKMLRDCVSLGRLQKENAILRNRLAESSEMTEGEKIIWAVAFTNEFEKETTGMMSDKIRFCAAVASGRASRTRN